MRRHRALRASAAPTRPAPRARSRARARRTSLLDHVLPVEASSRARRGSSRSISVAVAEPVAEARLLEQVRRVRHRLHPAGDDHARASPARIIESAISTARIDEAQTLLIVSAGVSIGSPAPIAAWRAGAWPAPPWSTWPMITYSTSSRLEPDPLERRPDRDRAELGRLVAGEAAAELAERRADGGDDHASGTCVESTERKSRPGSAAARRRRASRITASRSSSCDDLDRRVHVAERDRDEPRRDPARRGEGTSASVYVCRAETSTVCAIPSSSAVSTSSSKTRGLTAGPRKIAAPPPSVVLAAASPGRRPERRSRSVTSIAIATVGLERERRGRRAVGAELLLRGDRDDVADVRAASATAAAASSAT